MRAHEPLEAEDDEHEVELGELMTELGQGRAPESDEAADEVVELPHEVVRFGELTAAMTAILDGRDVDLDGLTSLDDRERDALSHLITVVRGFTTDSRFVYAEDRLEDLERILATLQPILSVGALPMTAALRGSLHAIVDGVAELRDALARLESAEEELDAHEVEGEAAAGDDQDDGDQPGDAADEAKQAAAQLQGVLVLQRKARKAAAAAAARKAAGPAPPPAPVPPIGERTTTLTGAPGEPAVERATPPSTVYDGPPATERRR